jgi:hypothetical protein
MSALSRTPTNTNFLQASKFILAFSRLPTVQYFCQETNVPGVNMGSVTHATPLVDVPIASNKINYNEFSVRFMIDEQIQSWNELYKWMLAIASPKNLEDRARYNALQNPNTIKPSYYSDATLTIMSALNNPLIKVNFIRMFPVSLTDIEFNTQQDADTILSATATFRYEYFDIVPA